MWHQPIYEMLAQNSPPLSSFKIFNQNVIGILREIDMANVYFEKHNIENP